MEKSFLTIDNARKCAEAFIRQLPTHGESFPSHSGAGIVICAGGLSYFTNAWVAILMLRHLGCRLPIQVWHLGPEEIDDRMRAIATPYDVDFIDALELRKMHPVRRLHGWELKPFSILYSRFRQVLLLDADNVPVVNPEFLFNTPQFKQTGAVFWPDFGHLKATSPIWEICGIPFRDEPEWEAGQILVDKERCWRALRLALWYNEHSEFYYQFILGDKDTYHLAFRKLEQPVAMPSAPVRALKWTLCQHDFEGNRIFQHRVGDKWSLDKENDFVWDFEHQNDCLRFVEELHAIWFGTRQRTARFHAAKRTQKANELGKELTNRAYQYERVGLDSRLMTFHLDGRIGQGAGICETYWDLKEQRGKVVLQLSSKTQLIAELTKKACGIWEGRWICFERMPVTLRPAHQSTLEFVNRETRGTNNKKTPALCVNLLSNGSNQTEYLREIPPVLKPLHRKVRIVALNDLSKLPKATTKPLGYRSRTLFLSAPRLRITARKTIWIAYWDSHTVPNDLVNSLNMAADIIVPSQWNASCFSCAAVNRPIWVIPPGIDSSCFCYSPMDMDGPCVFGAVGSKAWGDVQHSTRNVAELFLKAFPHEKDVVLRILSNESESGIISERPRIEIIPCPPTRELLASWLRNLTCLLSIGQIQAWPQIEHRALATGRPLIATRFGAMTELFSDHVGFPVEFSIAPARNDQEMLCANSDHVIEALKEVYANRAIARKCGINGRNLVAKFTWSNFASHVSRIVMNSCTD